MKTDEIICIIDRSGSMDAIASDAIGGFNTFLQGVRDDDADGLFTLILFNQDYDIVHHSCPLPDVEPLTDKTYVPSGVTALYDTVGTTLTKAMSSFEGKDDTVKPSGVTVAILTDGLENASRKFGRQEVASLIDKAREQYGWQFVFLAANQDAVLSARELHIPSDDAVHFKASHVGIKYAMNDMAHHVRSRRDIHKNRRP